MQLPIEGGEQEGPFGARGGAKRAEEDHDVEHPFEVRDDRDKQRREEGVRHDDEPVPAAARVQRGPRYLI